MESDPGERAIASVPASRALVWYGDAIRLWKRGPATFAVLAGLTVFAQLALEMVPDAGALAAKVVVPLVACGMLYGAAAAEAGLRPRLLHAISAFRAPAAAIAAIVLSSAITFGAEWLAADALAGVNLLRPGATPADLDVATVLGIYATGIAVSLPMTFVPLAALFGEAGLAGSFAVSASAFARNPGAFLLYGAIALALLSLGLVTMGIGLVIALPLIACATFVAWRDLCTR